jgi:hypothetical protein
MEEDGISSRWDVTKLSSASAWKTQRSRWRLNTAKLIDPATPWRPSASRSVAAIRAREGSEPSPIDML